MTNLVKKVQNTVFQQELFGRGGKIILAVSGGPDSVCLLDIFSKLQKKYSLELCIAHVNYGLRGKDSDKDEALVRKLGKKYGMEVFVLNAREIPTTPPSRRVRRATSPEYRGGGNAFSENALRDLRYAFFEKLRLENKFDFIAVAHNADDQTETFLMRIIRGAGLQGMTAMRFKNNRLIRPLLAITRKEILQHLKENKLTYRIDRTNLKNDFLRNKIRNSLIPYLEKNFNPNIKGTIFDSLVALSEDISFLDSETDKYDKKLAELDSQKLLKLPPAILRRIIRKRLAEKKGDLKNISTNNVEEILKIIKSTKNKRQVVTIGELKITRKGDKLEISRKNT